MELSKKISWLNKWVRLFFPPISTRFYVYIVSRFFTLVGARCVFMTLVWWNIKKEGSIQDITIMFFIYEASGVLGRLIFSPLGDFLSKKLLIELSYIIGLIGCIILSILITLQEFDMFLLSTPLIFVGLMEGMRDPICSSLIPVLVNDGEVHAGTRIRHIFDSLARLSGPGLAGAFLFYRGNTFTLSCGLFFMLITIVTVAFIKFGKTEPNKDKMTISNYLKGYNILTKVKPEMQIAILSMVINFSVVPFLIIATPAITKNSGLSSLYLGLVEILFGVGIIIGSSHLCSILNNTFGKFKTTFIGLVCTSLMLSLPIFQTYTALSLPVALFIGGLGLSLFNVNVNTLRLTATPEIYLSRLMSIVATVCTISIPFGTLVLGGVSEKVGLNLTFSLLGLGLFIIATVYFICFSEIKNVLTRNDSMLKAYYLSKWPEAFR